MGFVTKEDLTAIFTNLNTKLKKKPTAVRLTQAQYNELTSEEKHDTSKTYYVTDMNPSGGSGAGFELELIESFTLNLTTSSNGTPQSVNATFSTSWSDIEDTYDYLFLDGAYALTDGAGEIPNRPFFSKFINIGSFDNWSGSGYTYKELVYDGSNANGLGRVEESGTGRSYFFPSYSFFAQTQLIAYVEYTSYPSFENKLVLTSSGAKLSFNDIGKYTISANATKVVKYNLYGVKK